MILSCGLIYGAAQKTNPETASSAPASETMSEAEWAKFEKATFGRDQTMAVTETPAQREASIKKLKETIYAEVAKGNKEAVKSFVETYKQNSNIADKKGNTLLMTAVQFLQNDIVDYLLKRSDINTLEVNLDGNTALQHAVNSARLDFVQKIFEKQITQDKTKGKKRSLEILSRALKQARTMQIAGSLNMDEDTSIGNDYGEIAKYLEKRQSILEKSGS